MGGLTRNLSGTGPAHLFRFAVVFRCVTGFSPTCTRRPSTRFARRSEFWRLWLTFSLLDLRRPGLFAKRVRAGKPGPLAQSEMVEPPRVRRRRLVRPGRNAAASRGVVTRLLYR